MPIKKRFLTIALVATLFVPQGFTQTENYPVFTYGNDTVYSDEFMRGFSKNNRNSENPTQAEIQEYLDLYIRFKLKVAEAYARQMDTVDQFQAELAGYRKQLAQPYLTDKEVNDRLIKQAYERSLEEVRASHLLITCSQDASPEDTLKAYNQILALRGRIVQGGEDFDEMARAFSQDPSASSNSGDLGYFTVFQMIYPFENAAYNSKVGEVSMPFRTRFGYHLVKVKDRRKALGDVKVAHIMVKFYNETEVDSAKRRIDAVYQKLQNGADWQTMVDEFSEDYNSQPKGGELNWFNRTTPNMPDEIKNTAYSLEENGDYSKPIQTRYGWHIIKLVDQKEIASFDMVREALRRKVERDSRSELNKAVVVARVKKENNYVDRNKLSEIQPFFDSTLLDGRWKSPKNAVKDLVLFTIAEEEYTSEDFYNYVIKHQSKSPKSITATLNDLYLEFVNDENMKYEEAHLEEKYDDFKYIMQEYKDGILLFELTNKEVWSKAVEDTVGLEQYYNAHKSEYMYPERVDAQIFSCVDAKTAKKARKMAKKGKSVNEILDALNTEDALAVTVNAMKFEPGMNDDIDSLPKEAGIYEIPESNNRIKFVRVIDIIPPETKPLEKNLGQATSDYQNELESLWLEELRAKYPIQVFKENVQRLYN